VAVLIFSILLITAGAILTFAVTTSVPWISLQRVGLFLMAVGALTLVLAVIFRYTDANDGNLGAYIGQL
jgi:hypothetical protein